MVLVVDSQIAGISGDMLLCSLVDAGADVEKIKKCANIGATNSGTVIQDLHFPKIQKCGISATKLVLETDKKCTLHTGDDVAKCINKTCKSADLSESACKFASQSIQTLINAESAVHDQPVESVHFHEMAQFDTVLDIVGVAAALDSLQLYNEDVQSTPVGVGGGSVTFSHGTVSNPAPAILEIFKDSCMMMVGGMSDSEMTTPTGACMLKNLTCKCISVYPKMKINRIGYGAGKKDYKNFANVLKIVQGATPLSHDTDRVTILETCIDDVSGEVLAHSMERLMSAGARDVTACSVIGKKGRPANIITIVCDSESASTLSGILMSETGTLGVRMRTEQRVIAKRMEKSLQLIVNEKEFEIHFKSNESEGTFKIESDDIRAVSIYTGESFGKTEMRLRKMIGEKNISL